MCGPDEDTPMSDEEFNDLIQKELEQPDIDELDRMFEWWLSQK